ncbi:UvrD-helicase domain-containing protein [Neptunicoccus cionae]|uniref:UvrD-helicase domain-containing protein n=1 Tax=Neptunicoccus cionae TaxID=2035344 RepID=UPI000C7686FC|nr:UvrD-helicase domain-containing protein [Amylibacter cionae]PLS19800.1 RNA helicase [Amylibacter cionae]
MAATWWTNATDLDDEQKKVVALNPDGHHLVLGPPGSGKTNLLLLRAAYLHRNGLNNLVVLAFGRVLKEFLASGSAHYPFTSDKIQTYVRWGLTLLGENGVDLDEPDFDALRERLLVELSTLADQEKPENQFDCILLDEAQDYSPKELEVISRFTSRLFAVGDSKQRISTPIDGALDTLKDKGATVSTLNAHYRNGMYVCRVADGIQGQIDSPDGLEATTNYDEDSFPSTVISAPDTKIEEQIERAIEQIKVQLDAYPDELIGVMCPRKSELAIISEHILKSEIADYVQVQRRDDEYAAIDGERRVIVVTINGAKGLEFRAAHLLGMEYVKKFPLQKKMCYTAVTRCKTSLSVYHGDSLPGWFENGLQACLPPPAAASLDDLFE